MKIVSFTMINNESEIIESFARYNSNFVDEMFIIDNGCTDNSIEILRRLIDEGYPITIYDESLEPYDQYRLDNKYLNKIISENQPDIIIPLDADEFLSGDDNPRNILENLSLDRIYYVHWRWYVMNESDDADEMFIPKRLKYCFEKPAWNYSDGTPVTKAIIPARYYSKLGLTLSMGHHTVFGNENVKIETIDQLILGHYRAIGESQLIYKTSCYTMRDIVAMDNNVETAHRTNQMALIETGKDMWEVAKQSSYGGYEGKIVFKPLELSYCDSNSLMLKYDMLAREDLATRTRKTGIELAIRSYNFSRQKLEKRFLKPIVFWLDGVRGLECLMPDPSTRETILTELYNVRAYLTTKQEIKFLKVNYRLVITPEWLKFIPHKYVVVINDSDFEAVKNKLVAYGIDESEIISLKAYNEKLTILGRLHCYVLFIPSMLSRLGRYMKRNGLKGLTNKVKVKFGKE